jgi:hypothetical protein
MTEDFPSTIIGRLGFVCYWTGSAIAIVILLIGLTIYALNGPDKPVDQWLALGAIFIPAALSWLSGKALRYILAGA